MNMDVHSRNNWAGLLTPQAKTPIHTRVQATGKSLCFQVLTPVASVLNPPLNQSPQYTLTSELNQTQSTERIDLISNYIQFYQDTAEQCQVRFKRAEGTKNNVMESNNSAFSYDLKIYFFWFVKEMDVWM